jgi:hypothetical protein
MNPKPLETGDETQEMEAPPTQEGGSETGGGGNDGMQGKEEEQGFHTNTGWSDILPVGIAGLASLIFKNQKEGLTDFARAYGDTRIEHMMGERKKQQEHENVIAKSALDSWREMTGVDVSGWDEAGKQKVNQLNELYKKVMADGKITSKEALELNAYANMVRQERDRQKPNMLQRDAQMQAEAAMAKEGAGRVAREKMLAEGDPHLQQAEEGDFLQGASDEQLRNRAMSGWRKDIETERQRNELPMVKEQRLREEGVAKGKAAMERIAATNQRARDIMSRWDSNQRNSYLIRLGGALASAQASARAAGTDPVAAENDVIDAFERSLGGELATAGGGRVPVPKVPRVTQVDKLPGSIQSLVKGLDPQATAEFMDRYAKARTNMEKTRLVQGLQAFLQRKDQK